MRRAPVSPVLQARLEHHARVMRLSPTDSEARLWAAIRGNRLGVRFKRQVPIGPYIVDFYASAAQLVVEVDEGYHAQRQRADARRDRALEALGHRVVRVSAELVMHQLGKAIAVVAGAVAH